MKVDVSVQSYNKPESLIYALFCLHRVSKDHVDTVWINDDISSPGVVEKYRELAKSDALHPWKINIRVNKKRGGWWLAFVRGFRPNYQTQLFRLKRMVWNFWKTGGVFSVSEDIRYQWAIENTNKKLIFIMHDDIYFHKDIVGLYLSRFFNSPGCFDSNLGIAGDLGQCWRCKHQEYCSPELILSGKLPDTNWPLTQKAGEKHKWACRINEWSCLLNVDVAKNILIKDHVFFGNYDDDGDVAAFWFSRLVKNGYSFSDPLPLKANRDSYYLHWEDGITGHSAWVDQGKGRQLYDGQIFINRLKEEYGYVFQ